MNSLPKKKIQRSQVASLERIMIDDQIIMFVLRTTSISFSKLYLLRFILFILKQDWATNNYNEKNYMCGNDTLSR